MVSRYVKRHSDRATNDHSGDEILTLVDNHQLIKHKRLTNHSLTNACSIVLCSLYWSWCTSNCSR